MPLVSTFNGSTGSVRLLRLHLRLLNFKLGGHIVPHFKHFDGNCFNSLSHETHRTPHSRVKRLVLMLVTVITFNSLKIKEYFTRSTEKFKSRMSASTKSNMTERFPGHITLVLRTFRTIYPPSLHNNRTDALPLVVAIYSTRFCSCTNNSLLNCGNGRSQNAREFKVLLVCSVEAGQGMSAFSCYLDLKKRFRSDSKV